VILPAWKRADSLRLALQGLADQTLEREEFEVIVIDDGAPDATCKIVDLFRESLELSDLYHY
jgi:glycosyltransferase involved in cell wall biosynthesis